MINLTPLPGNVIVELKGKYRETEDGIVIPERFRKMRHVIGEVQAVNERPIDQRTLGHSVEIGQRLIMAHGRGRKIKENVYAFPLSYMVKEDGRRKHRDSGVLGIVPADVDLSPHMEELPRCQSCGNARDKGNKQGMLMVESEFGYYCPRCNRNEHGEKIDPNAVTITDREAEDMQHSINRASGVKEKPKGTIYSLPSAS